MNLCKNEGVGDSSLHSRTPDFSARQRPPRIPDLRAMLHRTFSLSRASGRGQHLYITFLHLGRLRRAAAAALTCDHQVSGSGTASYGEHIVVYASSTAKMCCHYVRIRVDVDKNVDTWRECYAYIPDHLPFLAVHLGRHDGGLILPPPAGRPPVISRLYMSARVGPPTLFIIPASTLPPTPAPSPAQPHGWQPCPESAAAPAVCPSRSGSIIATARLIMSSPTSDSGHAATTRWTPI